MKAKRKWQKARSGLRERLDQRRDRKEQPYYGNYSQSSRLSQYGSLPVLLVRQLQDNLFMKTVAAIIIIIVLGLFSLLDTSFTNKIVLQVYKLTAEHLEPATLLEKTKPVIQTIRDFRWRKESQAPVTNIPDLPPDIPEEMAAPVNGVLSSPYGTRPAKNGNGLEMHYGIDVSAEAGSLVYAAFSGTVSMIKEHDTYGTTIYIQHPDEKITIYGRVAAPVVAVGDKVERGIIIAQIAAAADGDSHLHFEIWEEKQPVDPQTFLTESTIENKTMTNTDTDNN